MAIYRGPGGAGDATVDATNAAAEVALKAQEAVDAATAAAASAAEAAASAVIASDGLDGIAAYAAAAAGSAATASTSASNASSSASSASTSASNASTSASNASSSASSASSSASAASSSASSASTSASNAATSASNASSSASSASSSAASAANSASDAAISASLANGYLPSFTGNNGKYLKTNGTNAFWETITDVAAATITNDGVLFGFTDESILQSTTTYTFNSTIYPQTPQNIVSGDGPDGHIAQTMAQAIINGNIVVGDPIKVTALKVSTNVVEEINLGTVSACSGLYNGLTSRWEFSITTTNPNSWNSSGYYNPGPGIYLYTIVSGPISYGDENTQLGYNAGSGLTLGTKNVIIGSRSATNLGNGSNNIIIGQGAQGSAVDINNEITLGNSSHTKTRLFGALAVGGSATGTSGQVLTSGGSGSAPSWTTLSSGTVTSVALTAPTGLTVSGSPVTTSGTLALSYTAGYSIPTDTKQTNWDTAYGWGNHASAGYLTGITSGQVTTALGYTPENAANKNAANGYAGLDSSGLVPSSILPSYVDDVLEYANLASFPGTGATGKIYVALDTNKIYRWSGSTYIEISASPGSTDAVTEGSTNLYFTDARARSAVSATGSLSYNSSTGVFSYTQPTNVSTFTNDSGYITSSALSPYLTSATAASTYAPLTGTGTSGTWGISVTGTAANITATSNSTLTTLSALSLPGSQVSGNISGNAANVTGTVAIANGGTGQTTQQAAINALTGTQSSGKYLRSDGTDASLSTIQAADVPTLNQNTTGTAANITATSNSTLTTLSALSLPGSQVSGNISGNAANVTGTVAIANGGSGQTTAQAAMNAFAGAVTSGSYLRGNGTNVVMSTIQAADVPTLNQNTTGTAANVTGTVAVANGGTGLTTTPANGALDIGNGTGFTRTTLTAGSNITITNGAGSITIAATGGGASAATPTALGTVYGKMTTSGGTPYLTALGYNAGVSSTGVGVTAVGQEAAYTNSTGTQNVAMGYQALYSNSTNSYSTAVGYQALKTATGGQNTALGRMALQALTSGSGNTGLGVNTLYNATTAVNNVAVGDTALFTNVSGSYNVGVGTNALNSNTTNYNNAVGYQAGYSVSSGDSNNAFGYRALYSNTTATDNSAFGHQALLNNTGGSNTAMGSIALYANTTGAFNTGVGVAALRSNTTASYNTAVGYQAAYSNTTGVSINAFGYRALYNNTTGTTNIAIGGSYNTVAALDRNTTGSYNIAIGEGALGLNTTANNNTAIGYQALYNFIRTADTSGDTTAIGHQSGLSLTTGQRNTFLGMYSGNGGFGAGAFTTGTYNISIGFATGASATNRNNSIVIGTPYAVVDKGENTGFIQPNGGGVYQGNNSSSWSTTSDRRLKKNIVDNNVGLEKLLQVQVRNFEYRLPEEVEELEAHCAIKKEGVQLGVIAQELQQVFPDCVKEESTGVLSVDPDNLTWYTINAIKQLKAELDATKAEIAALKGQA